ncbi:DUF4166 domain-containing protein [Massilia sp. TWR1-2-2]|uniref:DUF4166 domain-containing protein n=1 Tax=Massilia sp. TWR1-2-2 TaxID=2804584 RepID=UPI003CE89657
MMTTPAQSVYRQVLGADFNLLAVELQRFHSMAGRALLTGKFSVQGPDNHAGRLVSALFTLPKAASEAPFKFELDANARQETWRRHFPGRSMVSRMHAGPGMLVERFGPISFYFRLKTSDGQLSMLLQSVTVLGVPSPRFLMPKVSARESGADGRLHFSVSAHLPVVGLLAEYRGYLELSPGSDPIGSDPGCAAGLPTP